MKSSRRGFLTGLVSLIAAPAVVKIENIMPIIVEKPSIILPPEGWDVAAFYCPYVPLQYTDVLTETFIKTTNFISRYGVINGLDV